MKGLIIALILLVLPMISVLHAGTGSYAEHLFDAGQYPAAILEYQRWLFFEAADAADSLYAARQIARAYILGGMTDAGLRYLDHDPLLLGDPLFRDAMKCHAFLNSGQPDLALAISRGRDDPYMLMLSGIADLYLDRGRDARASFARLVEPGSVDQLFDKEELLRIAREADAQKRRSPLLAGTLAIIPGAGYAYTGAWQTALSAFLLHGLLFASAWELRQNDLPVSAGIIALIGTGMYAGNIYGSVSAAAQYNRARRKAFLDNELKPYLRLP